MPGASGGGTRILLVPGLPGVVGLGGSCFSVPGIDSDAFMRYGDSNANESRLVFDEGWQMMKWFID